MPQPDPFRPFAALALQLRTFAARATRLSNDSATAPTPRLRGFYEGQATTYQSAATWIEEIIAQERKAQCEHQPCTEEQP